MTHLVHLLYILPWAKLKIIGDLKACCSSALVIGSASKLVVFMVLYGRLQSKEDWKPTLFDGLCPIEKSATMFWNWLSWTSSSKKSPYSSPLIWSNFMHSSIHTVWVLWLLIFNRKIIQKFRWLPCITAQYRKGSNRPCHTSSLFLADLWTSKYSPMLDDCLNDGFYAWPVWLAELKHNY